MEVSSSTQRVSQACVDCKAKKLKCVPHDSESGACARCVRLNQVCRIPEKKRRAPKSRIRARIDRLEGNYEEILTLLSKRHSSASDTTSDVLRPSPGQGLVSPAPNASGYSSVAATSTHGNVIHGGLVSFSEAQAHLDRYRQMSQKRFPFVLLSDSDNIATLQQHKPLLLQTILLACSWRNRSLQRNIESRLLQDLSHRFFIQGEKTLDMLQALLVYLAWYHFYPNEDARLAYRFSSLATMLVLELGFNKRPIGTTLPTQHDMIMSSMSAASGNATFSAPKYWNHEVRRAFIGAHVVSIFCLIYFRKPTQLPYTEYLDECAQSLSVDPEYPSDLTLIHRVRQIRISTEVSNTFNHGSRETESEISEEKVHILVKTFERQAAEWLSALRESNTEVAGVDAHMLGAYINEIGLYGTFNGRSPSSSRIAMIFECSASANNHISNVLSLSVSEMEDWTSMDWRGLNYAATLATRTALTLDSTATSTESTARLLTTELRLGELISRAKGLWQMIESTDSQIHYFQRLSTEWGKMRGCLQAARERPLNQAAEVDPNNPIGNWSQIANMPWQGFEGVDDWTTGGFWFSPEFG